jgi:hypothetical protein
MEQLGCQGIERCVEEKKLVSLSIFYSLRSSELSVASYHFLEVMNLLMSRLILPSPFSPNCLCFDSEKLQLS